MNNIADDIQKAYAEGYAQGAFDYQANMDYPQDDAIRKAIDHFEREVKRASRYATMFTGYCRTAIAALRQMQAVKKIPWSISAESKLEAIRIVINDTIKNNNSLAEAEFAAYLKTILDEGVQHGI